MHIPRTISFHISQNKLNYKLNDKSKQFQYNYLNTYLVTVHTQCQLVKRFEKQINGLNIGIKSYLEVNLETNGAYHAI